MSSGEDFSTYDSTIHGIGLVLLLILRCSDRERHAPCAIVTLKTEMSHRFLQWMRPGLFPIFTIIFGTK